MQCTFKCDKKITPDAMGVDPGANAPTPIGGRYNRPKLDAAGKPVFAADDNGQPVPVIEQGTFVQVLLSCSDDDDKCHERHAHGGLQLLGLTEAAGGEFEEGAEYDVVITKRKPQPATK